MVAKKAGKATKRPPRGAPPLRFPKDQDRGGPPPVPELEAPAAAPPPAPKESAENGGRNARGQFVPGGPPGPGRPKGARDLRAIIVEHFERQGVDFEQAAVTIVGGLLKEAKDGNVPAAKLLLDRLFPVKLELGESFVDLIRAAWSAPAEPETPA